MLEIVVAGIGIAAGVAGAIFAASKGQALAAVRAELEGAREELEASREKTAKKGEAERRRDEELAELRRRLEKTKRRAGQVREEERQESERIRALEEQLRLAQADLKSHRGELQRLEAALAEAQRQAERRPPPPPPARELPPPPKPEAPPADETLVRRAEHAEARALGLEEALVAARIDVERLRRRAAAQEKLYAALRGELDAKKERLRTQQEELERLRALRAVLADDLEEPPGP